MSHETYWMFNNPLRIDSSFKKCANIGLTVVVLGANSQFHFTVFVLLYRKKLLGICGQNILELWLFNMTVSINSTSTAKWKKVKSWNMTWHLQSRPIVHIIQKVKKAAKLGLWANCIPKSSSSCCMHCWLAKYPNSCKTRIPPPTLWPTFNADSEEEFGDRKALERFWWMS